MMFVFSFLTIMSPRPVMLRNVWRLQKEEISYTYNALITQIQTYVALYLLCYGNISHLWVLPKDMRSFKLSSIIICLVNSTVVVFYVYRSERNILIPKVEGAILY